MSCTHGAQQVLKRNLRSGIHQLSDCGAVGFFHLPEQTVNPDEGLFFLRGNLVILLQTIQKPAVFLAVLGVSILT